MALQTIPAKHILTRNRSTGWFGADHTMNLYRGCSHGCIYCDSRSQCYGDENFDTVKVKENALTLLRDELRRKTRPAFIAMGSMSDPYNHLEEELELTRKALMLIEAYECGVAVCSVVKAAADAGAKFVYPAFGMTLRDRQREYYYAQLDRLFPGLRRRYEGQYGDRYQCTSPRARELWAAFSEACKARGLLYDMAHIVRSAKGPYDTQLTFFD